MKFTLKSARSLATILLTFGSLAVGANAAIVITFEETGGNVIATTSGSILLPPVIDFNFSHSSYVANGSDKRLTYLRTGTANVYTDGVHGAMPLTTRPTSGSGATFGIEFGQMYTDSAVSSGSMYSPVTTWIWNSHTLASIGLGSLTSSPTVVYTSSNNQTVSIAAIPEPSISLLFGISALALASRRRSKH